MPVDWGDFDFSRCLTLEQFLLMMRTNSLCHSGNKVCVGLELEQLLGHGIHCLVQLGYILPPPRVRYFSAALSLPSSKQTTG